MLIGLIFSLFSPPHLVFAARLVSSPATSHPCAPWSFSLLSYTPACLSSPPPCFSSPLVTAPALQLPHPKTPGALFQDKGLLGSPWSCLSVSPFLLRCLLSPPSTPSACLLAHTSSLGLLFLHSPWVYPKGWSWDLCPLFPSSLWRNPMFHKALLLPLPHPTPPIPALTLGFLPSPRYFYWPVQSLHPCSPRCYRQTFPQGGVCKL